MRAGGNEERGGETNSYFFLSLMLCSCVLGSLLTKPSKAVVTAALGPFPFDVCFLLAWRSIAATLTSSQTDSADFSHSKEGGTLSRWVGMMVLYHNTTRDREDVIQRE